MYDNLYEAAFYNALIPVAAPENGFIGLTEAFKDGISAGIAAVVVAADGAWNSEDLMECLQSRESALDAAWEEIDRLRALIANLAEVLVDN